MNGLTKTNKDTTEYVERPTRTKEMTYENSRRTAKNILRQKKRAEAYKSNNI